MRALARNSSQSVASPSPISVARGSRRQDRAREERPSHEVVASRGEAGAQPDQLFRRGDGCDGIVFSESARQGAGGPQGSLQGVVKAPANEQGAEPSDLPQGGKPVHDPPATFFDDRTLGRAPDRQRAPYARAGSVQHNGIKIMGQGIHEHGAGMQTRSDRAEPDELGADVEVPGGRARAQGTQLSVFGEGGLGSPADRHDGQGDRGHAAEAITPAVLIR